MAVAPEIWCPATSPHCSMSQGHPSNHITPLYLSAKQSAHPRGQLRLIKAFLRRRLRRTSSTPTQNSSPTVTNKSRSKRIFNRIKTSKNLKLKSLTCLWKTKASPGSYKPFANFTFLEIII
ncbi:hypothetical protein EJB05_52885 [Eragrostis curvula]|uniref:Uncharacterized protein n=1 Tax=Eragrostis curvula TaxID=38414 RepID=A0A5J9SRR5_9POAL|nr:hypothetical protein EJB05_52885 [Eragrostis curvula]